MARAYTAANICKLFFATNSHWYMRTKVVTGPLCRFRPWLDRFVFHRDKRGLRNRPNCCRYGDILYTCRPSIHLELNSVRRPRNARFQQPYYYRTRKAIIATHRDTNLRNTGFRTSNRLEATRHRHRSLFNSHRGIRGIGSILHLGSEHRLEGGGMAIRFPFRQWLLQRRIFNVFKLLNRLSKLAHHPIDFGFSNCRWRHRISNDGGGLSSFDQPTLAQKQSPFTPQQAGSSNLFSASNRGCHHIFRLRAKRFVSRSVA